MVIRRYINVSRICLCLAFTCIGVGLQAAGKPAGNSNPDNTRLVVVGDSLSAGVQNFSLLDTQQTKGYAAVIANQAHWSMTLPLIPFPGAPNKLEVKSLVPLVIGPVDGSLPAPPALPRDNPTDQPTNIAVPGLTVSSALTLKPTLAPTTDPEQQWATLVLGFPSLLLGQPPTTEIEQAVSLAPNLIIEWLGNNDALVPALTGQLSALTPIAQFALNYQKVLDRLAGTKAKLVTATIPDVTKVPYFTPVRALAKNGLSLGYVTTTLGVGPNDYLRPSAQPLAVARLLDPTLGALPRDCQPPLADLGVATLPCVLTAADARKVQATVTAYNIIIAAETLLHRGTLVDIHALVDRISANGYQLGSDKLTTGFFGGLFSLDGIHPTDTGYGVIANEFIRVMNASLGTKIPAANIQAIFLEDPLAQYFPYR